MRVTDLRAKCLRQKCTSVCCRQRDNRGIAAGYVSVGWGDASFGPERGSAKEAGNKICGVGSHEVWHVINTRLKRKPFLVILRASQEQHVSVSTSAFKSMTYGRKRSPVAPAFSFLLEALVVVWVVWVVLPMLLVVVTLLLSWQLPRS